MKMLIEGLPAELWFEIFKFFNADELLHNYHGLNNHFHNLLLNYFGQYIVNLESISKTNFNIFREHYLPLVFNQIKLLRLYNKDDSPQQMDILLPQNFTLDRFIDLRSLSLNHIVSIEVLYDMTTRLRHLQKLTHLTINNFILSGSDESVLRLINSIWSLPKLSYFHLDIANTHSYYFPVLQTHSSSLRHVKLYNLSCHQRDLVHLFDRTPYLQSLCESVADFGYKQQLPYTCQFMKKLHISYNGSWRNLENLLQNMPNLRRLLLVTELNINVNGSTWEKFITDHLPNLKLFRFKIRYLIFDNVDIRQEIKRLLDSFRNSFWLNIRQCCIRCDWQPRAEQKGIHLYTIPYMLDGFYECDSNYDIQSSTTCPHGLNHHPYGYLNMLDYDDFPTQNISQLPIRIGKTRHLTLWLPFDHQFEGIIPQFNRLICIRLKIPDNNMHIQLQTLLDQATQLRILQFIRWPLSDGNILLQHIRSPSVRQLDLTGFSPTGLPQSFNKAQCDMLSRTPLGLQCQVLFITVKERSNVLDIVQNLTNLRVLIVKCFNDRWEGSLPANDECIEWLRSQLPSAYSLSREPRLYGRIRIWIR